MFMIIWLDYQPLLRKEARAKAAEIEPIDPLHKWRLNLNNSIWYTLSLTFMFQDKGIFT